jgi:hypothetical protein
MYFRVTGALALLWACMLPAQQTWADTAAPVVASAVGADLRFAEFFKLPIGPRGLEPSAKLLALDGSSVRMLGYMARQDGETAVPGLFIVAPVPVTLGDEDESFADDLPASVLYVHLNAAEHQGYVQHMAGLLAVRGRLELGAQAEVDGRISFVRLLLDGEPVRVDALPVAAAPASPSTH